MSKKKQNQQPEEDFLNTEEDLNFEFAFDMEEDEDSEVFFNAEFTE